MIETHLRKLRHAATTGVASSDTNPACFEELKFGRLRLDSEGFFARIFRSLDNGGDEAPYGLFKGIFLGEFKCRGRAVVATNRRPPGTLYIPSPPTHCSTGESLAANYSKVYLVQEKRNGRRGGATDCGREVKRSRAELQQAPLDQALRFDNSSQKIIPDESNVAGHQKMQFSGGAYELQAVVGRKGRRADSGRYACFAHMQRLGRGADWWMCDDECVRVASPAVATRCPYLAFFGRLRRVRRRPSGAEVLGIRFAGWGE